MSVTISLFDLANLSISHPEPGVVNFIALHSLLHAIIKHLGIQDVQTEEQPDLFKQPSSPIPVGSPYLQPSSPIPVGSPSQQPGTPASVGKKGGPYQALEQKLRDVEQQVQDLSRLPTGLELLERSKQDGKSVNDMWNMLQLKKNMEANTEGVDKVMSLMEEVVQELNNLKNFKDTIEDRMTDFDKNTDSVMNHIDLINQILNQTPEQLQKFVSWKILQHTLVDQNVDAPPVHDNVQQSPTAQLLVGTVQAPDVEAQPPGGTIQAPNIEAQAPVGTIEAPGATVKTSGKVTMPQAADSNVQAPSRTDQPSPATLEDPGEAHPTQVPKPSGKPHAGLRKAASFIVNDDGAHLYPDAVSALQRVRFATDSHPILVQRVLALEKALAGLAADTAMLKSMGADFANFAKAPVDIEGPKQGEDMTAQVSYLRDMVKNIDNELKELRKFQPTSSEDGGRMQQQLDKLGAVLEKIMSSSCALLGMSLGLETEATCPVCSLDVSQDASNLCQRFQKLQDTVNTLIDPVRDNAKDPALRSQVQNQILQLQGECEKLNSTTSQLLQGEQLHQKNIEALFESMNRLEKKCGEGSISRTQFDAVTDQMNKMIQGRLSKICMQEKDWGNILERLTAEMECKLDRIELDPLKKQLEDRWKSIRKQLMKQKGFEQEGAAGLKKQLISHFHCLSCDRPLDIKMPCSQNVISLPMPTYPIPGHHPQRFDIEQPWRRNRGERIADLIDNFPTTARSCGGSHTLTYARNWRCPKVYDYLPTMVQDEDHSTKQWEDPAVTVADTYPPKARTNCKLPSIGGKDVNKGKPARSPSQKSSSTKLGSSRSHSAHGPTFPQRGFVMPERSASSVERECQCMTDPSLPCPCIGNQSLSVRPSLLGTSADSQSKETLEIHMDTSGGHSSPAKPINI